MPAPLREGIYEHLLTTILEQRVAAAAPARAEVHAVERADLPALLARHIARELEGALRDMPSIERQLEIAHGVLARLDELAPDAEAADAHVASPARILHSLYSTAPPLRPAAPLSATTLLTRAPKDPALGHELSREISSADSIDILAAFITMGGIRTVREELEAASRRKVRIRVLTSVFTGTTEALAVEALASLPGAEVRVSYDVRRTRLHAKAWFFERGAGLHTAYVGSANLTATALGSGLEWMVKLCAADLPAVIDKFRGDQSAHGGHASSESSVDASPGPEAGPPAGVRESEHDDVIALDLVRHDEREPVEARHSTVGSISPFGRRLGNRQPVESEVHGRERAARRSRTCARYSSKLIVFAVPSSTSAPRPSIS